MIIENIWPISKYVGNYPRGRWEFVKEFTGTYDEVLPEINRLQSLETEGCVHYRIWDDR